MRLPVKVVDNLLRLKPSNILCGLEVCGTLLAEVHALFLKPAEGRSRFKI